MTAEADRRAGELATSLARLEAQLAPASPDVLQEAILLILEPYEFRAGGEETKLTAYAIALEGVPAGVLTSVVRDFLQRKLPQLRRGYAPKPDELAEICHERIDAIRAEFLACRRELERLSLPSPAPAPTIDGPARARIAAGLADLASALARTVAEQELAQAKRLRTLSDGIEAVRQAIRSQGP